MTRRDFELIARTIRALPARSNRIDMACRFAASLGAHHPAFQREKFLTACAQKGDVFPEED